MKERGILLPIYSLPSQYGIGDFGNEAYEFIDILSENGINYWEVLSINACGLYPYSPRSYYALEEMYISLDKLIEAGLVKKARTRPVKDRIKFDNFKEKYYKEAFENFVPDEVFKEFKKDKEIKRYAEYMSEVNGESKDYYLFLQYIALKQWKELKAYANSKKVKIIGDMPAYPKFDSAETKYNTKYFEMEDGAFTYEAGAPPDMYNKEGQKWGCPVYNIKNIKKDKYKYFINKFKHYLNLFDKVRVDYFRGYDSFFKIPLGKSGKEGMYSPGVSYGFFDELFKDESVKLENLIIEDLGDIGEETIKLRDHYGFTRQKILQFSLDIDTLTDFDNADKNVLMYPGNHDCPTIHGWYKKLNDDCKVGLKKFLSMNHCNDINVNIGIMEYCMKCKAKMVVITVQDILGVDDSARVNVPGTISNKNWTWKLTDFEAFRERIKDFKK